MYPINHIPPANTDNSTTGCCPQFDPSGWDGQTFVFEGKNFVKAETRSFLYMPLNMTSVISKTWKAIEDADAKDSSESLLLTQDVSPWKANNYFWTTKEVAGQENVKLSGTFKSMVFEGKYRDAKQWYEALKHLGESEGNSSPEIYFYYTTCPRCAKVYGKNYVVGFVKIS